MPLKFCEQSSKKPNPKYCQPHRQKTSTPPQKQPNLEKYTDPLDSLRRLARARTWSQQPTAHLRPTCACCERAWSPAQSQAAGMEENRVPKHSNCLRCAALTHQREDAALPSTNWACPNIWNCGEQQLPLLVLLRALTALRRHLTMLSSDLYGIYNVKESTGPVVDKLY